MLVHLIQSQIPVEIAEPNVEVFRTNIRTSRCASVVLSFMQAYFPDLYVTIDLLDCDKVLRVQGVTGERLPVQSIRRLIVALGFEIAVLPD